MSLHPVNPNPHETTQAPKAWLAQAKEFYQKYEKYQDAAFFVGGFLFDMVMTGRIDEQFGLIQQAVYLVLIASFSIADLYHQYQPFALRNQFAKVWSYRTPLVHFFLGNLLNCYAIFYFKSASLLTSFFFLTFLVGMLIANELAGFKGRGSIVKFSMLNLCFTSYFTYLVPIFVGRVGTLPFAIAMILGVAVQYGLFKVVQRRLGNHFTSTPTPTPTSTPPAKFEFLQNPIFQTVMAPGIIIPVLFSLMYVVKILPPVPLSAQYLGVYHSIQKENGNFILGYTRPSWYFWESGDQTFDARPDDKIFVFTRLFSPAKFRDQIYVKWDWMNPRGDWELHDTIPMNIVGGREQGFRGFVYKSKYNAGHWRIRLTTVDNREIRRIYIKVKSVSADSPVEVKTERH